MCGKVCGNGHRITKELGGGIAKKAATLPLDKSDGLMLLTKPRFFAKSFVEPYMVVIERKRQMKARDS